MLSGREGENGFMKEYIKPEMLVVSLQPAEKLATGETGGEVPIDVSGWFNQLV